MILGLNNERSNYWVYFNSEIRRECGEVVGPEGVSEHQQIGRRAVDLF